MVHGALRRVDQWQQQLTETLESRSPPPDYIPGCFPEQLPTGPPINKYRLETTFLNRVLAVPSALKAKIIRSKLCHAIGCCKASSY